MTVKPTHHHVCPVQARDFVAARLYDSEDEVIRDALRHLLRGRPEARIDLAVHRYRSEDLSLAKAAELAGVSWAVGPESIEESREETESLRNFLGGR